MQRWMWTLGVAGLALVACSRESGLLSDAESNVLGLAGPKGSSGAAWTEADATAHGITADASSLVSTCPGHPGANASQPGVVWPRHDGCVEIELADGTRLTDDPYLTVDVKNGKVVAAQFWEQDVIGPEGVQYRSAKVSLTSPVPWSGPGTTLHIHAEGVPVYRLKGHTGGPVVAQAGTMDFGDIVYR